MLALAIVNVPREYDGALEAIAVFPHAGRARNRRGLHQGLHLPIDDVLASLASFRMVFEPAEI